MRYLFILCLFFAGNSAFGQQKGQTITSVTPDDKGVYNFVEQRPKAPYDITSYLSQNLEYPQKARKKNIKGRVIVQFVVNEDGSISDVKVMRGIGGGCDEEAARVIAAMPRWQPGTVAGKPVKVRFTQPITFQLTQ